VTLTFELDLDNVKMKHQSIYQSINIRLLRHDKMQANWQNACRIFTPMSFSSKLLVRSDTQRHTYRTDFSTWTTISHY